MMPTSQTPCHYSPNPDTETFERAETGTSGNGDAASFSRSIRQAWHSDETGT
jgi:hypothetical protein